MRKTLTTLVLFIALSALLLLPGSLFARSLSGNFENATASDGLSASTSSALEEGQIQPPTGPVTFCGTQALPLADSYTVVVDGGAPAPLTMTSPAVAACPVGSTHSFTLAASLFPVGNHNVVVQSTNPFGSTSGPAYVVTVGIAPGQFTITAVIPPSGE